MALPIWGLWMKKCLADGTLGISASDTFRVPEGASLCAGASSGPSSKTEMQNLEDYYFE